MSFTYRATPEPETLEQLGERVSAERLARCVHCGFDVVRSIDGIGTGYGHVVNDSPDCPAETVPLDDARHAVSFSNGDETVEYGFANERAALRFAHVIVQYDGIDRAWRSQRDSGGMWMPVGTTTRG